MNLQSTDELLAGIRRWVEVESQSSNVVGVNRMMDDVEGLFRDAGARVERIPGQDGFGDWVSVETRTENGVETFSQKITGVRVTVRKDGTSDIQPEMEDIHLIWIVLHPDLVGW